MVQSRLGEAELKAVAEAAAEAGNLQRDLMRQADEKHLKEFEANDKVQVNKVDRAAFREATAGVAGQWKEKPFGDFVAALLTAANA